MSRTTGNRCPRSTHIGKNQQVPWEPLPGRHDREPTRVGDALDRVLGALGAAPSRSLTGVFDRWNEIVGPTVAEHASPVAVKGDTLVIAVDDPAWATQLRFLEVEILAGIRSDLGDATPSRIDVQIRRERD